MKIAIASCSKLRDVPVQPAWSEIRAAEPDAVLLLGDNIYLSRDNHSDPTQLAAALRRGYADQFAESHFAGLVADLKARGAPLVAIYDDHDFLGNDRNGGDEDVALCRAAREEFVRAFRPKRTGRSVYAVHRLGLVDVVVLDTRYYRRAAGPREAADRDAVLGSAQWNWLEATLADETAARYTVVMTSSTFHDFGSSEHWEAYTAAFRRLRGLLARRQGTVVVSGDIHRNTAYDDTGVLEVVTSGVARLGRTHGGPRQNYGLLTFGWDDVRVQLNSLQVASRFDFTVPLRRWTLMEIN